MSEFKKYVDIERLKASYAEAFDMGEEITVSEKVDGSNASLTYDLTLDKVVAFSRRKVLDEMNTLQGFWEYTQKFDKNDIAQLTQNGRYTLFGEWLCLSGDTIIKKVSPGQGGDGMTLREMYKKKYTPRFKEDEICKKGIKKLLNILFTEKDMEMTKDSAQEKYRLDRRTTLEPAFEQGLIVLNEDGYIRLTDKGWQEIHEYYFFLSQWHHDGFPSLYSLNLDTDEIVSNKMVDIVYSGNKEVYEIITHKGYRIKTTLEHKFLTPQGWKAAGELKIYDCVAVTDFISRTQRSRSYGIGTHAIELKQKEYKAKIGHCENCGNTEDLELHHIDENYFNNEESNWKIVCHNCHKKEHQNRKNRNNKSKFDYEFDYIVDIQYIGIEDCYDICMAGEENLANFIGNNFIVHNCKNKIQYPQERYKKFYLFDVWDTQTEQYLEWNKVEGFFKALALSYEIYIAPIFYIGPFKGWEHIQSFVGQTELGATPCGEGVVIKSQDRLSDKENSRRPRYLKLVSEHFTEVQKTKAPIDPEVLKEREAMRALAATIVTKRRVEKGLEKLRDDNVIPVNWDNTHMSIIAKLLPRTIYEDCRKEELEIVEMIPNFGKICSSITMSIVRELLNAKESF